MENWNLYPLLISNWSCSQRPSENHVEHTLHWYTTLLGPRYTDIFQDPHMVKFLTYEASTSLNMFLSLKNTVPIIRRTNFHCESLEKWYGNNRNFSYVVGSRGSRMARGWVFTVKSECLDVALWKKGGAAVVLRLVQLATVSYLIIWILSSDVLRIKCFVDPAWGFSCDWNIDGWVEE